MATAQRRRTEPQELHAGDRMSRAEFHRLYERAPADFRAELIGGTVHVPSPLKRKHGTTHSWLGTLFVLYEARTPGVESGDNATILLGGEGEPQPDLFLRILPKFGGQSRTTRKDYIAGAPEALAEVALSSRSIDLHGKRDDYTRYGVLEYLIAIVRERTLRWFDLQADCELEADAGVYRLRTFPGLWIHGPALFAKDFPRLLATLEEGLATREHADFVRTLQANATKRKARRRRKP